MKYILSLFSILMLSSSMSYAQLKVNKSKKLLIYTKNGDGYVHENIATSVATLQEICKKLGVKTVVSNQPKIFTSEEMDSFDGVFFLNTNNEAFDTQLQKQAFQNFCRNRKGFGALHSATGSERDWPWYWSLIGGTFVRHAPFQTFSVDVIDATHPSTKNLSKRFEVTDECYYIKNLNPDIHVLLAADLTTVNDPKIKNYPSNTFYQSFPIAWYHNFEGGRQWYSSLGHSNEIYSLKYFQDHLEGGIKYLLQLND